MGERGEHVNVKILVADDDAVFRRLICDILIKQKYTPIEASNGKEAIDIFFSKNDIDMCILDVMMPVYNGWEVLSEIRERSEVPIMMLTALADEHHEVSGLTKGADDFISKPFSYPVFIARVDALLRKIKKSRNEKIEIGEITIDNMLHKVFIGAEETLLTNKEYQLLLYLIKNKNIVLSREKILDAVWGYDFDGDIRTIDAHIKMLRASLKSAGRLIQTIRGSGYSIEVKHEKIN